MARRKASEIPGYVPKPPKPRVAKPREPRERRKKPTAPPGEVVNGLEHVPTRETRARVASLAVVSTQKDVATIMGMSDRTLAKHYAEELRTAKASANAKVAGVLYQQAVSGKSLAATIFWLKAQAGWREKHVIDDTPAEKLGLALLVAGSGLRDVPQDALAWDRVIEGESERVDP